MQVVFAVVTANADSTPVTCLLKTSVRLSSMRLFASTFMILVAIAVETASLAS